VLFGLSESAPWAVLDQVHLHSRSACQ